MSVICSSFTGDIDEHLDIPALVKFKGVSQAGMRETVFFSVYLAIVNSAELEWLEHLWNHGNMFETGVVRVNEC